MQFAEIFIAILLLILFIVGISFLVVFKRDKLSKIKVGIEEKSFSIEEYKDEQKQKRKKSLFVEICIGILLVFSSIIFVTSLILRNPRLNKNSIVVSVNSDSMALVDGDNKYIQENNIENKIYKYDICKFNKINTPEDVKLYDIVLYKYFDGQKYILVAHRVIKVNEDYTYEVRGDANKESDNEYLPLYDILGVYEKRLPFPSFINYLTYTPGFYVFFVGDVALITLSLFFEYKEKKLIKD